MLRDHPLVWRKGPLELLEEQEKKCPGVQESEGSRSTLILFVFWILLGCFSLIICNLEKIKIKHIAPRATMRN